MNKNTAIDILDKQIADLNQRKSALLQLEAQRASIDEKMNKILGGAEVPKGAETNSRRSYVLPRGVLTLSAFETLRKSKKPMHLDKVVEEVKKSPLLHGNIPADISKRLRGILQTSPQFKNLGSNTFVTSGEKLQGALFERLAHAENGKAA